MEFPQVQEWMGEKLKPEDYGWEVSEERYVPSQGYVEVCPIEISTLLSCSCKKDCGKQNCSCQKSGVKCTEGCKCQEDICLNQISHHDPCSEDEEDSESEG